MAIRGRQTLYSIFVNGAIPTEKDYRDLIDSGLNRKDDHFFGEWLQGMKYCVGDVVIYNKALYKLIPVESEELCPPDQTPTADDVEDGCYCSVTAPPLDTKHWCVLELDLKDKDWEIVCDPVGDPDGIAEKIYQLTAKVGIGTDDPKALLDITNENKILLEPNEVGNPTISLKKHLPEELGDSVASQYVKYRLTEEVCWETDAMAYVFKLAGEKEANAKTKSKQVSPTLLPPSTLLMKVTTKSDNIPQVGIGVDHPKGGIDILEKNRGRIIGNPASHQEPGILIVNLEENGNGYYLLSGVTNEYAFLATNASDGFRFKKDNTDKDGLMNCKSSAEGKDLVAISGDGQVGVGTVDPKSNVEITDGESGSVRVQLGNDEKDISNPAISINNLRPNPRQPNSYITLGVDDDYGIIVCDAPSGVVIKNGGPFGTNDNEVNINQGKGVFYVSPEGKTGIKTTGPPPAYDLDVFGHLRSLTAYQETNAKTVIKTTDLKEDKILEKLEKLKPIRYAWLVPGLKGEGEHIGFMAQNVYEQFPELVKKTGPDEKAIAYGNMTAVLVQAIQDQQRLINDMEERICALEAKLGTNNS